jgi:ribosomal-protein-alanine N-acetyltransferase
MRVLIRAPTPRDEREFLAVVRESRSLHRPWVHPPDTPARYRAYLSRARRADFRAFLVCRKGDGAIVGAVNLERWALLADDWRNIGFASILQGYAPEPAR